MWTRTHVERFHVTALINLGAFFVVAPFARPREALEGDCDADGFFHSPRIIRRFGRERCLKRSSSSFRSPKSMPPSRKFGALLPPRCPTRTARSAITNRRFP